MDLQRLFLFLIFVFSLALVWDGWQRYEHPERYTQQSAATVSELPAKAVSSAGEFPVAASSSLTQDAMTAKPGASQPSGKTIRVKTDVFEAEISTMGGDIVRLELLNHPDAQDKNKPFVLFQKTGGTHAYIAQSGLLGVGLPNHNTLFVAEQESYELSGNAEALQVRLTTEGESGLKVAKILTFHKGSYLIDVAHELENSSQQTVTASGYFQLVRDGGAPEGSSRLIPTYTGAAVYTEQEKFKKVDFKTIDNGKQEYQKSADNGWIGMLQHYFVSAWLPKDKTGREYFTRKLDGGLYSAGVILPEVAVESGQKTAIASTLYAGPARSNLDKIAPGLGLTVDYGWLTIIATPLFWLMTLLNDWVHNWGVAIILLTVLIKLVFFPLSAASYRSMAKMRLVAPKLERIKQQYGDDREQLNRAMMNLYKTEKINPLGGCLPVLIQIPVFIALYWSILSSVEMRYAPFFGWITDLSAADPYYILPLIMGASMIVQTHLNPVPPDPLQAKVMKIMPIAFSVIFFFFPAGLVLYSIVNNLLSIAQQWYITRAAEGTNKGAAAKR